jgi:response regulator of citrate/malate metabolism
MIKVQIIEDYQQDISILENAIKQSGLEIDITVSRTIEEAIEVTSKNNFDCIFLDYYFPKQNGSDFLRYYSEKKTSREISSWSPARKMYIWLLNA